ncbi:hypothetical protein DICVIV_01156 [Dictyocaulus viviparus]|uniref:Uncharacterized protein n=1 Tax=Dictyocaulus viviparus TaxID=29172 RepID=A0A0D8Y7L2_DICVI|nr:hypothetical protein DICVIV_01156 [Dictyocaulus viviparus]
MKISRQRTAKGGEIVRHAQLSDGMLLKFYKAPFDDEPCEQYVIYGFQLRETELESGGTQFDLIHHNQIRTDRKEHVISFRVEHEKSVNKDINTHFMNTNQVVNGIEARSRSRVNLLMRYQFVIIITKAATRLIPA